MAKSYGKRIHRNDVLGERGVNLVQRVVLDMGCMWYPTGGVEANQPTQLGAWQVRRGDDRHRRSLEIKRCRK